MLVDDMVISPPQVFRMVIRRRNEFDLLEEEEVTAEV